MGSMSILELALAEAKSQERLMEREDERAAKRRATMAETKQTRERLRQEFISHMKEIDGFAGLKLHEKESGTVALTLGGKDVCQFQGISLEWLIDEFDMDQSRTKYTWFALDPDKKVWTHWTCGVGLAKQNFARSIYKYIT